MHVIDSLDPADGGPPRIAASLAAAQAKLGHEVTIASRRQPDAGRNIREMVREMPGFEQVKPAWLPPRPGVTEQAWPRRTRQELRPVVQQADVLHLHNVWEGILRAAADLARDMAKPYFVILNGMLDPWSLDQSKWKKRLALWLAVKQMLNGAAALHLGNETERELIKPLGLTTGAVIIPNGVFLEHIEPLPQPGGFRVRHPELHDAPFMLFMSRLHYKKGPDRLIEGFARFAEHDSQTHLVVAGPDAGARDDVEQRISRYQLTDRIHLVGPIYGQEKAEALVDAACFVLPSHQEGFSVAITEALAYRKPVLITPGCHFDDVGKVGAGEIVSNDPPELAQAMSRMMTDPERRRQMGQAGRSLVAQRFTWPRVAEQTLAAYRAAMNRSGSTPTPQHTASSAPTQAPRNRALRILHVIHSLDPADGGPPKVALSLAATQARQGHDVKVLAHDRPWRQSDVGASLSRSLGDQSMALELVECTTYLELITARRAIRWLRPRMPQLDILHLHGVWEPLLLRTAQLARRHGVPYVLAPHGMLDPWSLSQKWLKKQVALRLAYRQMLERAAALHTLNKDECELVRQLGLRVDTVVVPNGVDLREMDHMPEPGTFRRRYPHLYDRPYFLFLSRLHYKKGLDLLAEAFARYITGGGEANLVVTGPDDGAKADFERRVERHGMHDRVLLTGPLYGPQKLAALQDASAFVLISRQEGFSLAITEAMACRLPVLITDACHFPEVTESGAGLIVPVDVQAICKALFQITRDPEVAKRMGEAGRELVEQRYSWTSICEQLIDLYREQMPDAT